MRRWMSCMVAISLFVMTARAQVEEVIVVGPRGIPSAGKASLTLEFLPRWEIITSIPQTSEIVSSQITWTDFKLTSLDNDVFKVRLKVPDDAEQGSSFEMTARLNADLDDILDNNQFVI